MIISLNPQVHFKKTFSFHIFILLLLLFSFSSARATIGSGVSPRFNLKLNFDSFGQPIKGTESLRLNIVTDRIGFGFSPYFSLNTGNYSLMADYFHLGDDQTPPCSPPGEVISGALSSTIPFSITSSELSDFLQTGAQVSLLCFHVESYAQTEVRLNGHNLASLPANPTCQAVEYLFPVTTFLHSGINTLEISLGGSGDLPDLIIGDVNLVAGVSQSGEDVIVGVAPAFDQVDFQVSYAGAPFDDVRVEILYGEQVLMTGVPSGGEVDFAGLEDGQYSYVVRPFGGSDTVIESGLFIIDRSNIPPELSQIQVQPPSVANDGVSQVSFLGNAIDTDGSVESVSVDLSQIGGSGSTQLQDIGGGAYELFFTVPAGVPPAAYTLPLRVVDDRGSVAMGEFELGVTPSQTWDETILVACGFEIRASNITETSPGVFQASGNVQITHPASGLPLMLDASGALTVVTGAAQQITADADVTLKANLGELGIVDLAYGQFNITSDGTLQLGPGSNSLLSQISGHEVDAASMNFQLLLGEPAGIKVTTNVIFDKLDGIPDNNYPQETLEVSLLLDGTVLGSLTAEPGILEWDLAGGTMSFDGLSWLNTTVTVEQARFAIDMVLFDSSTENIDVEIPECTFGPDGFQSDGLLINNFDFNYGGFEFNVNEAYINNDHIRVAEACIVFPIPGRGDVASCVYDIEISDNGLDLAGGEIQVPPLKIGTYDLAGVYAHFENGPDGFFLQAEGALAIPAFATVGIAFTLDTNCDYLLQEFCMAADFAGRGIPIGNTGFLLTDIGGCLEDQGCQNNWLISFTAGLSSADRVDPPGISLISADVQMDIQPQPFRLGADGTLFLVGQQLSAGGFNIYTDRFEGWGNIQVPPGIPLLVAQSDLNVHWSPQFDFHAGLQGVLQVPADRIPIYRDFFEDPIILGEFEAAADMVGIRGCFNIPASEPYIASVSAEYTWASGGFEFHTDWNTPWLYMDTTSGKMFGVKKHDRFLIETIQGKSSIETASSQVYLGSGRGVRPANWASTADKTTGLVYRDTTETIVVPEHAAPMLVILEELPAGEETLLTLNLISPVGTVIDSTYCAGQNDFTYLRGEDAILFRVAQPDSGSWKMVVGNLDDDEDYSLLAQFQNRAPLISVASPVADLAISTDDSVLVSWSAEDPDAGDFGSLKTTLYAIVADSGSLNNGDDAGPWLVAEDLPDSVHSFTWLPQSMPSGNYRLMVETTDSGRGAMAKTVADTSAVVTLENVSIPWQVSNLELAVGPESLLARWGGFGRADLRGYRLFWSENGTGWVDTLDVGRNTQHLLTSLKEGVDYDVWVEAYDVMGTAGSPSETLTANPHPLGDVQPPAIPSGLVVSYDPDSGVAATSWNMVEDAFSYRLHYDLDVVGSFLGTGAAEGDSPVLQGREESLTLTGLVPGRRYYLAVSSLDAAGNESLPSDPVTLLVSQFTDLDEDGLPDDWETENLGSLEYGPSDDPDGDFLDNATELNISLTHPAMADTDGDHVVDGNDDHPLSSRDLDHDGMADDWENEYGVSDPAADPDSDFLTNVREFSQNGLPWDNDTDSDGLGDGFEADSTGTAVWNWDTDGGGVSDGVEYSVQSDPLDPADDFLPSGVEELSEDIPRVTKLGQPSPNPFNARLSIPFALAKSGPVKIRLYDIAGRLVRELVNETYPSGRWEAVWDGQDDRGRGCASGVYFVRFRSDGKTQMKKTMLVK